MARAGSSAMLLPCLLWSVLPTLHAQGRCTLQTIAGTYQLEAVGSSTMLAQVSPDIPFHWQGLMAPIAITGTVTFGLNGRGDGQFWAQAGTLSSGMTSARWQPVVLELTEDCLGVLEFEGSLGKIKERFIVFDNGKTIRSIPMETSAPTATWVATMRRVAPFHQAGNAGCTQSTLAGRYLIDCRGVSKVSTQMPFPMAASSLMYIDVGQTGTAGGMWYLKGGPAYLELPITGSIAINQDCSGTVLIQSPAMPGFSNRGRIVMYEGSAEGFILPLVDTAGGVETNVASQHCRILRVGR